MRKRHKRPRNVPTIIIGTGVDRTCIPADHDMAWTLVRRALGPLPSRPAIKKRGKPQVKHMRSKSVADEFADFVNNLGRKYR